jgi:hypothetical protein
MLLRREHMFSSFLLISKRLTTRVLCHANHGYDSRWVPCSQSRLCQIRNLTTVRDRSHNNKTALSNGYFGIVDRDSEDRILRPASVYSPKKRIVAIASKETGTHIPFSSANCIVR